MAISKDSLKTQSMNYILCVGILLLNLYNSPIKLHFTGEENVAVRSYGAITPGVFYALRMWAQGSLTLDPQILHCSSPLWSGKLNCRGLWVPCFFQACPMFQNLPATGLKIFHSKIHHLLKWGTNLSTPIVQPSRFADEDPESQTFSRKWANQ